MPDPVVSMLRFFYLYGRAVGVMNFEVDWRTGEAKATRRATILAAAHNVGVTLLLFYLNIRSGSVRSSWIEARLMHEYFFLLMTVVRTLAVLLALASRWRQRRRILRLWKNVIQMIRSRPEVVRLNRRSIMVKFVLGVMADSLHSVLDHSAQRKKIASDMLLNLLVLYAYTTMFNVIVGQYYLAILQIHAHYLVLQKDLKILMQEAESVCQIRNRRGGVFATKCCFLADQVDELAERHSKLHATCQDVSEILQIQSFSMTLVYYLSTMATIYYSFCSIYYKNTDLSSSYWGLLLLLAFSVFYYLDCFITLNVSFVINDQCQEMITMLAGRAVFSKPLDQRLETAFESLQLQLAQKIPEFYVLGLFKMERSRLMAMGNSVITYSILLIQWELQNK
ncbi:hypothetical protein KR026_006436 [Drosophila bipectinata]|nr:hypothetical protein KR026_006436 [Drosophila bipectinata]